MTQPKNDSVCVNNRHLTGFRRFQNAALKALRLLSESLRPAPEGIRKNRPEHSLKVSDMKSLVSTYKEAVSGERALLGLSGGQTNDWPEEVVVHWKDPEEEAQA